MGNDYTTTFAAGSFHTQKKLFSILYSIEMEFYFKNTKIVFEPPFSGFKG